MKNNILKYVAVAITICIIGVLYSCERQESDVVVDKKAETSSEIGSFDKDASMTTADTNVCIHISGYVRNPGVYMLPVGSRIYEAVELAGGFLPEADETYLNLAAYIEDGQKLVVLSKNETATISFIQGQQLGENGSKHSLVNINTATKEELMTLSGIGESRALSIIKYREKYGNFKNKEDIKNVSGIKEAAYEKISDSICVK